MAHVVDGEGQSKEQIVAHDDPCDLHTEAGLWNEIEQNAGNCHQYAGYGDPGTCLALTGTGLIDDSAHDDIGEGVKDLGQQWHQGQEQTAHP